MVASLRRARTWWWIALAAGLAGCGAESSAPLATAQPGVIFTYPGNNQLDVPPGTNVVVTFSEPVVASGISAVQIVGPDGAPLAETPEVTPTGDGVIFKGPKLAAGTTYDVVVGSAIDPQAKNLPGSGPLFSFTTHSGTPRAAAPTLLAVDGTALANATAPFRPLFETSTIRLVFSEPLDPRTLGAIQLLDASHTAVAATVIGEGVHVSIDPTADLTAGMSYTLAIGAGLKDLGGTAIAPINLPLTPVNSINGMAHQQVLRTRDASKGDPGPKNTRSGVDRNVVALEHPLIGKQTQQLKASALNSQLGDPKALQGPIAFTIRKGQRLNLSGLDVKLGGALPSGLATDDITIEFLTDVDGRLYRNPWQPESQRPENLRSPVYVDLTFDLAIYAKDPGGNAVLTQTILGVQATGTAIATEGVLAIETVAAMNLGLLGLADAPVNFVMELITDSTATPSVDADATAPTLLESAPTGGTDIHPVGGGVSLIFDEPIDLTRASAGGITLRDNANNIVPSVIESHGAAVVIRPLGTLSYSALYKVRLDDVADVKGNAMPPTSFSFYTENVAGTNIPLTVTAVHPGAACALANGHCAGGADSDDTYQPFKLPANETIEVAFSQPVAQSTMTLGALCNQGSVRVEQLDGSGACSAPVPGTLIRRDRSLAFVPDQPWTPGTHYRLALISGNNNSCNASGEVCGMSGAASFDPLQGASNGDGGGPDLVQEFIATPATTSTFLMADTWPVTDWNGSNTADGNEAPRDENRAAMLITGTGGSISKASFSSGNCPNYGNDSSSTCMYLQGTIPSEMGELSSTCPLADGSSASQCIPVTMTAQVMYGTSVTMKATLVISTTTDTNVSVMRVREPSGGVPLMGYIVDRGGTPTLIAGLSLYMDAPDMSVAGGIASHDLHSKPLDLVLSGPVTFQTDGRIAIGLANTADVPITVNVDATIASGSVNMILPKGEMKLQLMSRPLRGGEL